MLMRRLARMWSTLLIGGSGCGVCVWGFRPQLVVEVVNIRGSRQAFMCEFNICGVNSFLGYLCDMCRVCDAQVHRLRVLSRRLTSRSVSFQWPCSMRREDRPPDIHSAAMPPPLSFRRAIGAMYALSRVVVARRAYCTTPAPAAAGRTHGGRAAGSPRAPSCRNRGGLDRCARLEAPPPQRPSKRRRARARHSLGCGWLVAGRSRHSHLARGIGLGRGWIHSGRALETLRRQRASQCSTVAVSKGTGHSSGCFAVCVG